MKSKERKATEKKFTYFKDKEFVETKDWAKTVYSTIFYHNLDAKNYEYLIINNI